MPPLCSQCGEPLDVLETLANWQRGPTLYPRRRMDGRRVETLVRWLCRKCQRRASRHREHADTAETLTQDAQTPRSPARRSDSPRRSDAETRE